MTIRVFCCWQSVYSCGGKVCVLIFWSSPWMLSFCAQKRKLNYAQGQHLGTGPVGLLPSPLLSRDGYGKLKITYSFCVWWSSHTLIPPTFPQSPPLGNRAEAVSATVLPALLQLTLGLKSSCRPRWSQFRVWLCITFLTLRYTTWW